jgi:hypothetical protein
MHCMPHKDGSRSPEEENDSAQTELVMRTPVNEAGSQGQAAEHLGNRLQMPTKKEHRRIGARVFAPTVIRARLAFVYRPARL